MYRSLWVALVALTLLSVEAEAGELKCSASHEAILWRPDRSENFKSPRMYVQNTDAIPAGLANIIRNFCALSATEASSPAGSITVKHEPLSKCESVLSGPGCKAYCEAIQGGHGGGKGDKGFYCPAYVSEMCCDYYPYLGLSREAEAFNKVVCANRFYKGGQSGNAPKAVPYYMKDKLTKKWTWSKRQESSFSLSCQRYFTGKLTEAPPVTEDPPEEPARLTRSKSMPNRPVCTLQCANGGHHDHTCAFCECTNHWDSQDACNTCLLEQTCRQPNSSGPSPACDGCVCSGHWAPDPEVAGPNCEKCSLECPNGKPNKQCTGCGDCSGNWGPPNCETCGLKCQHGASANKECTACDCGEGPWTGQLCDVCSLEGQCGRGRPNADCTACVCPPGHWTAESNCKVCSLDCKHGGHPNVDCTRCDCDGTEGNHWDTKDHCATCKIKEACEKNGGLVDENCTHCICQGQWAPSAPGAKDCDTCTLSCANGRPDDHCRACVCPEGSLWNGVLCDDCQLGCQHGGAPDSDCKHCVCDEALKWGGENCNECQLDCGDRKPNADCTSCGCDAKGAGAWGDKAGGDGCDDCLLPCRNGGAANGACTVCECQNGWALPDCKECGLRCQHGGTPNGACSACDCAEDQGWEGETCGACALQCQHGGGPDAQCKKCSCQEPWTGDQCETCNLDCPGGKPDEQCEECIEPPRPALKKALPKGRGLAQASATPADIAGDFVASLRGHFLAVAIKAKRVERGWSINADRLSPEWVTEARGILAPCRTDPSPCAKNQFLLDWDLALEEGLTYEAAWHLLEVHHGDDQDPKYTAPPCGLMDDEEEEENGGDL